MLRISKLTDYGTVVLARLATDESAIVSAAELAAATGLALPTVSKLLKTLARAELVQSTRGPGGGYRLARPASSISAADVIDALEGPVSITECSSDDSHCEHEGLCAVGGTWQRINIGIRQALDEVTLQDLSRSCGPLPKFHFGGLPITISANKQKNS